MNNNDLLEKIAEKLQLQYLSELRNVNPCSLQIIVSEIGVDNYSLAQWQYTLSYILGVPIRIACEADIDKILYELV